MSSSLSSESSRAALGYAETIRRLERLRLSLPSVESFEHRGQDQQRTAREGTTLFDEIVEIIHAHGLGGNES
jgi:hypothetical protein